MSGSIVASESSCAVSTEKVDTGTHRFSITNNGSKVTEVEFLTQGDRAVGEAENIGPGTSRDLTVDLAPGEYQVACRPEMKGYGVRSKLTVTGTANTTTLVPALASAVASYRSYVSDQADQSIAVTQPFVDAVKAGDVNKAKALYAPSRVPYERIEPIAESFGDLDPAVDARAADLNEGDQWTGWHRLEKDLWVDGLKPDSGAIADGLMANLQKLKSQVSTLELTPSQISNGAQGLLDEVATSKVTGEEEAYSHTDLSDFLANIQGANVAIDSLRPYLQTKDPDLLDSIDTRFGNLISNLNRYKTGETFTPYDQLTQEQIRSLADQVEALSEPVSKVTAVVTGK